MKNLKSSFFSLILFCLVSASFTSNVYASTSTDEELLELLSCETVVEEIATYILNEGENMDNIELNKKIETGITKVIANNPDLASIDSERMQNIMAEAITNSANMQASFAETCYTYCLRHYRYDAYGFARCMEKCTRQ